MKRTVLNLIFLGAIFLLQPFSNAEAPSNDLFANAIPLNGDHLDVTGSNVEATIEADEPDVWFIDQTVWWSWVAPNSGCVTLQTNGASFPTDLNVFRGSSLTNLVKVSEWNFSFDVVDLHTIQRFEFDAESGKTYYIQAKGALWAEQTSGPIRFQLDLTENLPVEFPDTNLEAIVRAQLGKVNGSVTRCDLHHLTSIVIDDPAVTNLAGLEWANELNYLSFINTKIQDFSPVSSLCGNLFVAVQNNPISNLNAFTNLPASRLMLSECGVQDISALKKLTNLVSVTSVLNPVTNYSAIAEAQNLREVEIWCSQNPVTNLSMFVQMTNLNKLAVNRSEVTDLSPLLEMSALKDLELYDNPATNHSLLGGMTNLQYLSFNGMSVTNLDFLGQLTQLRQLTMYPVGVSDFSVLGGLTNLESLALIEMPLTNTSFFSNLTHIDTLRLTGNSLREFSFVQQLPLLSSLELSYNPITNYSPLCGLTNLANLYLDGTGLSDLSFLQCLPQKLVVELNDNSISDLSSLTDAWRFLAFSASGNLLTNIDALSNFTGILDIRTNLLDVRLGSPARAIIDNWIANGMNVKFAPQKLPPVFDFAPTLINGNVSIQLRLNPGQRYELQSSEDLLDWEIVTNFISDDSPALLNDDGATNRTQRFYRIVAP